MSDMPVFIVHKFIRPRITRINTENDCYYSAHETHVKTKNTYNDLPANLSNGSIPGHPINKSVLIREIRGLKNLSRYYPLLVTFHVLTGTCS